MSVNFASQYDQYGQKPPISSATAPQNNQVDSTELAAFHAWQQQQQSPYPLFQPQVTPAYRTAGSVPLHAQHQQEVFSQQQHGHRRQRSSSDPTPKYHHMNIVVTDASLKRASEALDDMDKKAKKICSNAKKLLKKSGQNHELLTQSTITGSEKKKGMMQQARDKFKSKQQLKEENEIRQVKSTSKNNQQSALALIPLIAAINVAQDSLQKLERAIGENAERTFQKQDKLLVKKGSKPSDFSVDANTYSSDDEEETAI